MSESTGRPGRAAVPRGCTGEHSLAGAQGPAKRVTPFAVARRTATYRNTVTPCKPLVNRTNRTTPGWGNRTHSYSHSYSLPRLRRLPPFPARGYPDGRE